MNSITIALTVVNSIATSISGTSTRGILATKFGELPINVELWGKMAETCNLQPGAFVLVSGEIHTTGAIAIKASSIMEIPTLLPINTICLAGNTGRDPEIRFFQTGKAVTNLTLAVRRGKDLAPNWFNITCWDKSATVANDWTRKGTLIGVTGRLGFDTWDDRNSGELRVKAVVTVERLELLGKKPEGLPSRVAA